MSELAVRDINWARKITERLRLQATNYQDAREKVIATLTEARDGGAADLLGYASWTAYMADVFGDAPLRLERDARQELVAELSAQGLSTRAIAPIVGAGVMTVHDDIQRVRNRTPEAASDSATPSQAARIERQREEFPMPLTPREFEQVETLRTSDEPPTDALADAARKITGMDGKQYTRPEPKKPQRRALTDVARDAGWDIRKATEKVERIREDDRYSRNKEEVAAHLRGHLMYVIETCHGILDDLNESKEQS